MSDTIHKEPLAAQAHVLSKSGDWDGAQKKLIALIGEITGASVTTLTINRDQYSLNSLNGLVSVSDGSDYFFKYHHEEGEEQSIEEYYRAELLKRYGFPVDVPVFACKEPGRQILLYRQRDDKRLADVCRKVESEAAYQTIDPIVNAQIELDKLTLTKTLESYKPVTENEVESEAIHQLFYRRLVDGQHPDGLGGRVNKFYVGKIFQLGDTTLDWENFSQAKWCINGVNYPYSIEELFTQSANTLKPSHLADHGAVTAHGDAHNANVWYENGDVPKLSMFDPAFAGEHIPALLAEVKATFHNIFAHPYWLYEPNLVEKNYHVSVQFHTENNTIYVKHDWTLTQLRQAFLDSKIRNYWQPLIRHLDDCKALPSNWQEIIRLGLFCCPTLVMDLRADGLSNHTPYSSPLGFAVAVSLANPSQEGLSAWVDELLIS
ncbi:hypothetical protein [Vibrio viridaestus]|uniref:Aminoglycoside phosphotransferase domain-containing protein n=1 Tax=Vibrio viridaestus TaxID=2487322 RepID=A0A3N9THH1_9VIBR|nr:hypothetical protein [Vibrio viridaestus]RQW63314.1 hypothetical protein EES38_08660 [Vibrio viridaestus]